MAEEKILTMDEITLSDDVEYALVPGFKTGEVFPVIDHRSTLLAGGFRDGGAAFDKRIVHQADVARYVCELSFRHVVKKLSP